MITSNKKSSSILFSSALAKATIRTELASTGYADSIWEGLLLDFNNQQQAQGLSSSSSSSSYAVVEVGVYAARQCLQAARAGFQTHCIEPSPKSFDRIKKQVDRQSNDIQQLVHLYNVAAGGPEESIVPFVNAGQTGDHVGFVDYKTMKKLDKPKPGDEIANVPSKPLDTILANVTEKVYLMKVDTQGFEPNVFAGLDNMLSNHQIQYIMTEFWPRGMDILVNKTNRECVGLETVLGRLLHYGYTL
jgi:FkbM family methyltransferase